MPDALETGPEGSIRSVGRWSDVVGIAPVGDDRRIGMQVLHLYPDGRRPGGIPFIDLMDQLAVLPVEETQVCAVDRIGEGSMGEIRMESRPHPHKQRKIGQGSSLPFDAQVLLHRGKLGFVEEAVEKEDLGDLRV